LINSSEAVSTSIDVLRQAQHERIILNVAKPPSVHPELVEGRTEGFSTASNVKIGPRSKIVRRQDKSGVRSPRSDIKKGEVKTAAIRRFEDIQAWQQARILVREVYKSCAKGQLSRDFGFKDQLCRAAVSSMSNIAEGFAKKSDRDFAHFLDIARGSITEVQSLLYVALDVGYLDKNEFDKLREMIEKIASLISGLTSYLRKR
jgi:four helix bundle protein